MKGGYKDCRADNVWFSIHLPVGGRMAASTWCCRIKPVSNGETLAIHLQEVPRVVRPTDRSRMAADRAGEGAWGASVQREEI